jgi:hypothetical protein
MGKVASSNPYTNKKGDLRLNVMFDYSLALRIATGDLEALEEIRHCITVKVENAERKAQEGQE